MNTIERKQTCTKGSGTEELREVDKKKNYLKQYRSAIKREKRILDEIERLKMDKSFPADFIDGLPKYLEIKDFENCVVLFELEIEKLKSERLEKIKRYRDIENRIRAITNEYEQETLRLHYILGLTWEEVAEELGFTYRHVMRMHKEALNSFKLS